MNVNNFLFIKLKSDCPYLLFSTLHPPLLPSLFSLLLQAASQIGGEEGAVTME